MFSQLADIGKRLKQHRIENRLSPEQIADALSVSRAAVYRIESGSIAKIETLNRLSALFGTSLPALLGAGVESYTDALSYFERMRCLESECDQIVTCYTPISTFLTSDDYVGKLRRILSESIPPYHDKEEAERELDAIVRVLAERKKEVATRHVSLISFINPPELDRWLRLGSVGGGGELSAEKIRESRLLARQQVEHLLTLMRSEPMGVQIALVDRMLPGISFQILRSGGRNLLCLSPFRCVGEFLNVHTGVGMITTDNLAVTRHEQLVDELWKQSIKGAEAVDRIQDVLDRAGIVHPVEDCEKKCAEKRTREGARSLCASASPI